VVLGAKRYNHYYVDTFQLALDFERRHSPYLHHQAGDDVGTPSDEDPWMARFERGGDDITDWHSGIGMYTIASFSLVRPLLTLLSRNQSKRCAIEG